MSSTPSIGRISKLSEAQVKKIWPREEQDLSPWIKDHIEEVNSTLGLDIQISEVESSVGNFRLDLGGLEARTQKPAVIENQFGKTDHDHLGKLLTYAAGREAGILIWIAMEFQEPHRAALNWLNQVTGNELLFYGLELEVYKIDESRPAPKFTVTVQPPDSKRPRPVQGLSQREAAYQDFWTKFLAYAKSHEPSLTRAKTPQPTNWFYTGMGFSSFGLGANFTGDGQFRVEIYIDTGIKEQTKQAFAELEGQKGPIEEQLGEPLEWQELPERRACRITLPRAGTIVDPLEKLSDYISWGVDRMVRLRDVFKPRISQLTIR